MGEKQAAEQCLVCNLLYHKVGMVGLRGGHPKWEEDLPI